MTTKTNIVVCGYPKSGTTWLSRLVAELVDCPFQGTLGFSDGRPLEGPDRQSGYDCYKTHHTFTSLVSSARDKSLKVIYIVRDPRDVAISAAHHFRVSLIPIRHGSNRVIAAVNARLDRVVPYTLKRSRMVNAVLYGDASVSLWLGIPWRDHYEGFRRSDTLVLKYEDLLERPLAKCHELLVYLGVSKPERHIAEAIANQSFDRKKASFAAQGKPVEFAFLRRGSHGYWRTELDRKQKRLFVDEIGEELRALAYPLD